MDSFREWLASFRIQSDQTDRFVAIAITATYIILGAFLSSVALNAVIAQQLSAQVISSLNSPARLSTTGQGSAGALKSIRKINFHRLKTAVVDRNLFNSDGEIPEESEPGVRREESVAFDMEAPCQKNTLNLDLLGTIYMGSKTGSLATVKEKGYSQADVYRVGDAIYGAEQAFVAAIGPKRVVINHRGQKECLELEAPKFDGSQLASPVQTGSTTVVKPVGGGPSAGDIVLDADYVEKELGEGYVNILNKARLVPFNQNGVMTGFKLIGLDSKSLIGKVGLKNQDVITQVNDISLQQPDQGFAFFQAFEDEREIRISFLRGGTTPMTINVKIK